MVYKSLQFVIAKDKISKGKSHGGQNSRETDADVLFSSLSGVMWKVPNSASSMIAHMKYCEAEKFTRPLAPNVFIGGRSCSAGAPL